MLANLYSVAPICLDKWTGSSDTCSCGGNGHQVNGFAVYVCRLHLEYVDDDYPLMARVALGWGNPTLLHAAGTYVSHCSCGDLKTTSVLLPSTDFIQPDLQISARVTGRG